MLELRLLGRVRDVPENAWNGLVGADGSPFVEWAWLDCLEEADCVGGDSGWVPHHFALFRDEKLVAAAPAYLKGNSEGEFVFDWSWADLAHRLRLSYYPKLVLAVPFTPATGQRVLVAPGEDQAEIVRAFSQAARAIVREGELSSAHVLFPGEAESKAWVDAGFLSRLGVQYHWRNEGYVTFDDFLGRFNSKRRNQLKREIAQPAKDGVVIETLSAKDLTTDVVQSMYRLYLSTVDKFTWGRRYLTPRFFDLVAERFSDRLAWVVARLDGEIIAGAFNVKKGKTLYGRYWGSKVDLPFLHFNVCYYHGIRQAIAEGLDTFEPGAGGEHKRVRGFDPAVTYSAHWIEDERFRGILASYLERETAAVRELVTSGESGE
jgi:predicted N-acyltransferase